MKKVLSIMFACFLSIFIMFGCTDASALQPSEPVEPVIFDSVDDNQPIEPLVEDDPVVPDTSEPVVDTEPVADPEPAVDPNEELTWQFLEVSEEWLKDVWGMGLKRDGKLYSLSDIVQPGNFEKTGMGYKDPDDEGFICSRGDMSDEKIIVDDRFIIPCISGEDDVAFYGEATASVKLVPMADPTYTIPVWQDTDVCKKLAIFADDNRVYKSDDDLINVLNYREKSTQLIDADGNDVLSSLRDLNYGETYTLKWSDGSEELKAFWRYYKPTGEAAITLGGEPTDDPEVTKYDFSSIPSGLYYIVESYTLVEVKND